MADEWSRQEPEASLIGVEKVAETFPTEYDQDVGNHHFRDEADSGPEEVAEVPVRVIADIAPQVTFASHQCDVAVIGHLVVTNELDRDLEDLTLHLAAEPAVVGARAWTIDKIEAGTEFRPRDRRIFLAGGMLDALTERMRAEIVFELRQGANVLAESRHQITALARNEWGGAQYMPELLAAFIMPNDPAVQRLLKGASGILGSSGRRDSLEGYQSKSRKRVWEIVSAIWAAMTRLGLTYAEPPASFGRLGQKIRLPSTVEDQGLATCLDMALFFAAAIEQAGLAPIVAFTKGHALAGVWLQPQTLPTLTVDDPMEIRKAIEQDEMVLFETTMATGAGAHPFSRAIAEGKRQVSEANEAEFIYAIDIRQARGRDIQPLPSLQEAGGVGQAAKAAGEPIVPPLEEAPDLPLFDVEEIEDDKPETPTERLDRWKRSLLDLSKRNRLLNLKPSKTAIPIFCPDVARLEDKIASGQRIRLVPPPERTNSGDAPDRELYRLRTGEEFAVRFAEQALERNEIVANVDPLALEKGALELFRKAKADFEEGGSNTLFLALGMLRWSPPGDSGRSYRAPLILLPVKLERKSAASKLYLTQHEDDEVFNLTLLQMLRQDFDIDMSGFEHELPTDDHGVDVEKIWRMVQARVRDVPGMEVVEETVLSTFSFAKYLMWKDLADRTEVLKESLFVRHIIDTPREAYGSGASFLDVREIDAKIDPAEIMAPLNADSSQIVAIYGSGGEGDFVLEGPPGTGKSETIGNIIAHNLGLGRRVLFVSEKMAALDVVHRRLEACGLGDFCLELHSAKANKRAVIGQLHSAWESRRALSRSEWLREAAELKDVRDKLNGLVEALHTPGPGGLSPRDAIGRSLRFGDVHRLRLDWERDAEGRGRASTPEALKELEKVAKRLGQQYSRVEPGDVECFSDIAHTEWSYAWNEKMVDAARVLSTALQDLANSRKLFTERLRIPVGRESWEETDALSQIAGLVETCAAHDLRFVLGRQGRDATDRLETLLKKFGIYHEERKKLSADYSEARIVAAPLETWIQEKYRIEAKMWPFRAMARRRFRKTIREHFGMTADMVRMPERDLETLDVMAEAVKAMDGIAGELPQGTPWRGTETDADATNEAIHAGRLLREVVNRICACREDPESTRETLTRTLCDERESLEPGMPAAVAAKEFARAWRAVTEGFENYRAVSGLTDEVRPDLPILLKTTNAIIERERRLNLWCAWVEAGRDARELGLGTLVTALEVGAVAYDQAVEAFRTAYATWLAPILIDTRPELTRFSSVGHEDLIRTFRELDVELAKTTAGYIRSRLSENVPAQESREADPGYGVLAREIQKRARHKPVRQLVSEMGDALMTLTPCLMMSPLSVAQFLPAEVQSFDLVVFDEASQITVPDAIGAIARGRRCVVAGDPRQMPPTRFFERGADDDENEDARDLESILDEALAARVPHHRLIGHYRSRHESLICFSNHAYYQGTLVTYPSADTRETAVSFHRVDGVYAKGRARTNAIEAREVVAEVVRRLQDPELSKLSIGIVTLNAEQQRLVEDLLDQERRRRPAIEKFFREDQVSGREKVMVKNLETVQGDQRDVILMSIGYGPTEPGAKTMSMNFGPLNRQGGERRLNVAITRATTEVVVFASFDAAMIDLSRTNAQAVHDLKHYIDFAARGPVALSEAIRSVSEGEYDSDFELAVAERLRGLGWSVRTQIGVTKFRIDLGIVHPDAPGRFLVGVECDGATYHSSPSARDRDRVRQIILEKLGWRLVRIWSTDFFLDPDDSIARLDARIRAILDADRTEAEALEASRQAINEEAEAEHGGSGEDQDASVAENAADDEGSEIVNVGAQGSFDYQADVDGDDISGFDGVTSISAPMPHNPLRPSAGALDVPETARAARLRSDEPETEWGDPNRFYDDDYRPRLREMAAQWIDAEGPITFKRLSDRAARAHGFQRTKGRINSTMWAACMRLRPHARTADGHVVFWPEGQTPTREEEFRGLKIAGETREWREVPQPEKLGLVRQLMERGVQDLAAGVASQIGYARITAKFREEVEALKQQLE